MTCRNDMLNDITSNYGSVVTKIFSRIIKKTNFLVILYYTFFCSYNYSVYSEKKLNL